jgi:hypothetical protein
MKLTHVTRIPFASGVEGVIDVTIGSSYAKLTAVDERPPTDTTTSFASP